MNGGVQLTDNPLKIVRYKPELEKANPMENVSIKSEHLIFELIPKGKRLLATLSDSRSGRLMALARQSACDAECRVETDGKGGGTTGFATSFRRTWVDPVACNICLDMCC